MKRFFAGFCLLGTLSTAAFADLKPYTDPGGVFRVDLPGRPTVSKDAVGRVLEASDGNSQQSNVVGVIVLPGHTRYELLALVEQEAHLDTKTANRREVSVNGYPALRVTGITNDSGVPYSALLVGGKKNSLILVSRGFDLNVQQQVLQSLRVR